MAIANLIVKFLGDDKSLKRSLRSAKRDTDRFVKQTEQKFNGLQSSIGKAFAGLGAAVSVGGLTAFTKGLSDSSRELSAWSQTLNLSVQDIQRWQFAAKSVGIETDKLTDIFKDVNDKLGDFALTGGGEAADVLQRLGFVAADFKGLKADEALLKIGAAVQNLGTQERIFVLEAIANDLSKLSPLLNNNGAQLRKLTEEFNALGLGIDKQGVKSFSALGASLTKTTEVFKAFGAGLLQGVNGPITQAVGSVEKLIKSLGGARKIGQELGKVISDAVAIIPRVAGAAAGIAGSVVGRIQALKQEAADIRARLRGETVPDRGPGQFTPQVLSREGLTKTPNTRQDLNVNVKVDAGQGLTATATITDAAGRRLSVGSDTDAFTQQVAQQVSD